MSRRHYTPRVVVALTAALVGFCGVAVATTWTITLHTGSSGEAHGQTVPSAPASPTATCVSGTETVKVAWTAVTHAVSYSIYKSTTGSGGSYTSLATGVTANPYTTATLTPAGTYYFKVTAFVGTHWVSAQSVATPTGRVITTSSPYCA